VRGVILVSLENASFHMVHVYTINWFKKVQNINYCEITNISFLAKLFFKTFISLKHLSDYRTVGLSDRRTIGLSDFSQFGKRQFSYGTCIYN
jgi:hypothetical protein